MALEHKMMCNVVKLIGSFRQVFLPRGNVCVQWQQTAGLKQSLEEKLGIPTKPKRPLTPFFRFMAQVRPTIKHSHPHLKVKEIMKLMAQQWESADESLRKRLDEEFKRDMVEYTAAVVRYKGALTDEQREDLQHAKEKIQESQNRKKLKKKQKELGKPKKPLTAFLLFLQAKAHERKDQSFVEWHRLMGAQWADLPEQQKAEYVERYQRAMDTYRKDLREWEERMIRLGHIDVVRDEVLFESKLPFQQTRKPAT